MAELTVELVAVDGRGSRQGKANCVFARTTMGEMDGPPGHEQMLAQMEDGIVRIDGVDGPSTTVAVHGGFLHVTPGTVTILAEWRR